MNGADRSNSTPAPGMHRRAALVNSAALLLLASAAAGPAKATEIDGELLARCAEYQAADRESDLISGELQGLPDGAPRLVHDPIWSRLEAAMTHANTALDRIIHLPARTPEGIAAKAAVLRVATSQAMDSAPDAHELLALSLADDIAGRA